VPKGAGGALLEKLGALPPLERRKALNAIKSVHTANGRQTLAAIAKKYALDAATLARRTGLDVSAVPAKGQKVPIPAPEARYTLLPEARALPLTPLVETPGILVADAAALAASPEERAPPAGARSGGVVTVRVTRAEPVPTTLRGVFVVAGAEQPLPLVDVVAGVSPVLGASAPPPPVALR
jgi:hypothetical protein